MPRSTSRCITGKRFVTAQVTDDVFKKMKIRCILEDRLLQDIAAEILTAHFEQVEQNASEPKVRKKK